MGAYIEVIAVQRPHPVSLDAENRVLFSVNFDALALAPVGDWEGDIADYLHAQVPSLATRNVDTFTGPGVKMPTGVGPYINIIDSGGNASVFTHDGVKYERLSAQIVVRATEYTIARARALAVWRALDGLRNVTM